MLNEAHTSGGSSSQSEIEFADFRAERSIKPSNRTEQVGEQKENPIP